VLHVRLTELHAAHQNLLEVIRTLHLKVTIQNIHQKRTKSDNMIRTLALCRIWRKFFNRSNLFITYFQCLMGFECVTVQLRRSSHYTNLSSEKVTKWHLLWMQHTKTCFSRLIEPSLLQQML